MSQSREALPGQSPFARLALTHALAIGADTLVAVALAGSIFFSATLAAARPKVLLYLAITIILIQNAVLPPWLGVVMLLRFCVPLLAALGSYFLFAHPVRFGSTIWGKYAGLAQCLYFLVLLAPLQLVPITRLANLPLLVATLILLVAAPIAQIAENVRATHV